MQYRTLGKSDARVSVLGLGCRGFGRPNVSESECIRTVETALEHGVNFFDTADVYGDGRSESILGKALGGKPREDLVVATKGGSERIPGVGERQNGDPRFLRKALEDSLRRLQMDYIDLYQLHNPDPAVPLGVTAEAFARFVEEGKVRHVGVSNMSREQLAEWLSCVPDTVSIQLPYSVADARRVLDLYSNGRFRGISLIPWTPLFIGWLVNPPAREAEKRTGLAAAFSGRFICEIARNMPGPEVLARLKVTRVLCDGHVGVLEMGAKVRLTEPVNVGDELDVDMWDLTVKRVHRR